MDSKSKDNFLPWTSIAAIFGDVVVSPWNLLIGGLLISKLSIVSAIISIISGYSILALIMYFYGGLGMTYRKKTSELLEPIFGKKGNRIFFSAILAVGQIGWFAIINQIGGESLARILQIPAIFGIVLYGYTMLIIASLSLHKFALVKYINVISSILLLVYLFFSIRHTIVPNNILFSTNSLHDILWGIAIVVTSLISFSAVTPDFISQLRSKSDIIKSIFFGIFIPGAAISLFGAIIFSSLTKSSLNEVIGISSFALFGHIFNILTNTDAAVAIYTPGNRLQYMFGISFKNGVAIATVIGVILSLLNISSQLELWLSVLAALFPAIIGVTIAYYMLKKYGEFDNKRMSVGWKGITTVVFSSTLIFLINITFLHWVVGIMSFVLYILMTGVTINIYIGNAHRKI